MNGWVAVAVSSLVVVAVALQASSLVAQAQTKAYVEIKREAFQKEVDARPTDLYTVKNGTGMVVKITNQGAKIVQILAPDKNGQLGDVVLGYESVDQYVAGRASYGAIIGRYANRIAKGRFTLNGQEYQLPVNNGPKITCTAAGAATSASGTPSRSTIGASASPTSSRTVKRATRATRRLRSCTR